MARARAEVFAAALAVGSGAVPASEDGRRWRWGSVEARVEVVPLPAEPSPGDPALLQALVDGIRAASADRAVSVRLLRPLPDEVDLSAVFRAVAVWIAEVSAQGAEPRAVYDDGAVGIEVWAGASSGRDSRPVLVVPPPLMTLRLVQILHAVRTRGRIAAEPVVLVLAGDEPWRLTRSSLERVLYGHADEIIVEGAPDLRYEARFPAASGGLLSKLRRVAALWWLAPDPTASDVGLIGHVHANPWATVGLPAPPLATFARVGAGADGSPVLGWTGPRHVAWRPAE